MPKPAQEAAASPKPLNPKQQRFVEEYLIDLNATQAAIRAGITLEPFRVVEGAYVYLLIDPRNDAVFYVGKGTGRRPMAHLAPRQANVVKGEMILAIRAAGLEPQIAILESGLTDDDAYRIESALIRAWSDSLTNIAQGTTSNGDRAVAGARELLLRTKPFMQWLTDTGHGINEAFAWLFVVANLIKRAALTEEQASAVKQHLQYDLARMLPPTVLTGWMAGEANGRA